MKPGASKPNAVKPNSVGGITVLIISQSKTIARFIFTRIFSRVN